MSENTTDQNGSSGKKDKNQPEDLFEATRRIADKTEEFITQAASKFQSSETFGKVKSSYKKMEGYLENKSDEFSKSNTADKLGAVINKTIDKADMLIRKAEAAGRNLVEEIDEAIDSVKEKAKKNKW